MEHQKVLRISTIVLAMAIFSLVVAKPGMAYARSHLSLGDFDLGDIHFENGKIHGAGGAIGGALGAGVGSTMLGPILSPWAGHEIGKKLGNDYSEWVKKHNEEYMRDTYGEDSEGNSLEHHGDHEEHGTSDHEHSESSRSYVWTN